MSDIDAKRAARRAAMPITTQFLEQFAEFGATLVYARENEHSYGKKPEGESAFDIPRGYRIAVGGTAR